MPFAGRGIGDKHKRQSGSQGRWGIAMVRSPGFRPDGIQARDEHLSIPTERTQGSYPGADAGMRSGFFFFRSTGFDFPKLGGCLFCFFPKVRFRNGFHF